MTQKKIGAPKRYTEEALRKAAENASCYRDILRNLGIKEYKQYIGTLLKSYGIPYKNSRPEGPRKVTEKTGAPKKYTEEVIRKACKGATSYDDVIANLGYKGRNTYIYTLLKSYGISYPKKKLGSPILDQAKYDDRVNRSQASKERINKLVEATRFLEEVYTNVSYPQRAWHKKNGTYEVQFCVCSKPMLFKEKRYKYCSKKCTNRVTSKARESTMLNKYGVINSFQSKAIKRKIEATCMRRYGVPNGGASTKALHYKDYTLPSGRVIRVQGYEDRALDILLTKYKEDDILYGPKEIHKKIGIVKYKSARVERKYFPDFLILSENRIVEVKSTWTYDRKGKDKELRKINELKRQACIDKGLNFEFMIL